MINADDPVIVKINNTDTYNNYDYITSFFDKIKDVNITDFDFEIFKEYITELTEKDFNKLWDDVILDTLKYIEDNYIFLETDKFELIDTTKIKKNLLIRVIEFIMDKFPYDVFYKHVMPKELTSVNEVQNWLDDNEDDLRNIIIEELRVIETNIRSAETIIKLAIDDVKKAANREKYKDRMSYINKVVNINSKYNEYFISLIQDTSIDKLKDLLVKYAEKILEI